MKQITGKQLMVLVNRASNGAWLYDENGWDIYQDAQHKILNDAAQAVNEFFNSDDESNAVQLFTPDDIYTLYRQDPHGPGEKSWWVLLTQRINHELARRLGVR